MPPRSDDPLATTPALNRMGMRTTTSVSTLCIMPLRQLVLALAKLSDEACQAFGSDSHLERHRRARCPFARRVGQRSARLPVPRVQEAVAFRERSRVAP
jgi:hypothetical protein